jgi:ATP-dependent Clp protease ATP-binding subunit ClpC
MTSNIGTQYAKEGGTLGFIRTSDADAEARESRRTIEEGLKKTFRPEFLNRVDEIIIFHTLTLEHMQEIVDLQMREIRERLNERGVTVELGEEARQWLAEQGYDPAFGARPLRRTLQRYVESPLSKRILRGEMEAGDHVLARVNEAGDGLDFEKQGGIPVELPQRAEPAEKPEA